MVVLALLLALLGVLTTLPRMLRVRRLAQSVALQAEAARVEIADGLELLERRLEEAGQSARPLRRLRKWITHPLSVAAFQSYRRRSRRG
jgi:hypothetical protein